MAAPSGLSAAMYVLETSPASRVHDPANCEAEDRIVTEYRITHMKWDGSGTHFHPTEVTFRKPGGSEETTSANRLPFAVNGDVISEPMGGLLVHEGRCTTCGRHVMTSDD